VTGFGSRWKIEVEGGVVFVCEVQWKLKNGTGTPWELIIQDSVAAELALQKKIPAENYRASSAET